MSIDMTCLSLCIKVNYFKCVVRSSWLEEFCPLAKADSSSVLILRSLCKSECSQTSISSREVGLITVIKHEASPNVWFSVERNFYIFSTITNEVEDLEIVVVYFCFFILCLWRELKVITRSLDSAFAFSNWDFELIGPGLEILSLS